MLGIFYLNYHLRKRLLHSSDKTIDNHVTQLETTQMKSGDFEDKVCFQDVCTQFHLFHLKKDDSFMQL